jgi:hypothetical protein
LLDGIRYISSMYIPLIPDVESSTISHEPTLINQNYMIKLVWSTGSYYTQMLHGAGIFTYMTGWFLGQMLVNIPAPWSIWDIVTIYVSCLLLLYMLVYMFHNICFIIYSSYYIVTIYIYMFHA